MTFFVDANVLVYSWTESRYHDVCHEIVEAVARGDVDGRSSPSVLEEVWHLESSKRAGDLAGLTERAYAVFSPLLPITDGVFRAALAVDAPGLDTNDRVHVATCLADDIRTIVSADARFDRVPGLHRVDPLDVMALRRLLTPDR